jgi:OOP family OmpA-OmpF porin
MTDNLSVELLAAYPFEHDIALRGGGGKVASTEHLPPTLSLQWHFMPQNEFKPYVGVGLNYTGFFSTKTYNALDGTNLSLGSSWGWAGEIGTDIMLGENWLANFSMRYIDIDSDARLDGASLGTVEIDPYVITVAVGYKFGGKEPPPPPPPAEPPPPPPPPPNPDLDGDGVLNEHDKCPNTRPGAVVDLDGCEVEAVIELDGVNFDFDKATLRPDAKAILDQAVALLEKHERVVVEVAGHTDSIGPEDYNQGLSERRAQSVQDYLVSKGIRASRLTARGYGETMPIASNDTKEGRAENRRVELIVLDR